MDTIVVGIDDSTGSQQALEWALDEAQRREARVRLIHAVPPAESFEPYFTAGEIVEADIERHKESAQNMMAGMLEKAGGAPVDVTVDLVPKVGPAPNVLVDESADAAMVVVGSRGRGGFAGLLLGSVSQQVAQHARSPVVVVRPSR